MTDRVDNRVSVETPEAVEFDLDLVGILPRTGAWSIDALIKLFGSIGCCCVFSFLDQLGVGIVLLTLFFVLWLYNPVFEVFWNGQTPGKKVFGIRVVNRDGTPVGWYGSIIRNLVRLIDIIPFGYQTAAVTMVVSGRFQRLGDVAGDTLVVYDRDPYAERQAGDLPQAEPIQIPVALKPHEQEAIIDFAERSKTLGSARSAEIARVLSPITEATDDREATRAIYGLAQRIVRWG